MFVRQIKNSVDLSCCLAVLKFAPMIDDDIWPNYRIPMKIMEDSVGLERTHKVYETHYEAERLVEAQLPLCQYNVKRYLIHVILQLLHLYAYDWNELQYHMARDGWFNRLYSDEKDYQRCYEKMKLLHYTNFILPEEISQDKIDDFVQHFNLK